MTALRPAGELLNHHQAAFLAALNEHAPDVRRSLWDMAQGGPASRDAVRAWALGWHLSGPRFEWFVDLALRDARWFPRRSTGRPPWGRWTAGGWTCPHGLEINLAWQPEHESRKAFRARAEAALRDYVGRVERWADENGIEIDERDRSSGKETGVAPGAWFDLLVQHTVLRKNFSQLATTAKTNRQTVTRGLQRAADRIGLEMPNAHRRAP